MYQPGSIRKINILMDQVPHNLPLQHTGVVLILKNPGRFHLHLSPDSGLERTESHLRQSRIVGLVRAYIP